MSSRSWSQVVAMLVAAACGGRPSPAPAPPPRSAPLPEVLRARAPQRLAEPPLEQAPPWSAKLIVPGARPRLVVGRPHRQFEAAAFSRDEHLLATIDHGGIVILWDVATGRELRRFAVKGATEERWFGRKTPSRECGRPSGGPAGRLAFTSDGRLTVLAAGCVQIWDVVAGTRKLAIEGAPKAWAEDLRLIAVEPGSRPGGKLSAMLVDTERGAARFELPDVVPYRMSADGTRLVVDPIADDDQLRVVDTATGREVSAFRVRSRYRVVISRDGKLLAAGSAREGTQIFDTETGRVLADLRRLRVYPHELVDGGRVLHVKGAFYGSIDTATGRVIARAPADRDPVFRGTTVVWYEARKLEDPLEGRALDTLTGKRLATIPPWPPRPPFARSVSGLVLRGDAIVAADGTERPLAEGAEVVQLRQASESSRVLIEASRYGRHDQRLFVFDLASGETLFERTVPRVHRGRWRPLDGALSVDGAWIAVGRFVHPVAGPASQGEKYGGTKPVAVGPNRSWILARDGMYWRERGAFRKVALPLLRRPGYVSEIERKARHAVSRDGKRVATTYEVFERGTDRGGLLVWDGATGATVQEITPADSDLDRPRRHSPVALDAFGARVGIDRYGATVLDVRTGSVLARPPARARIWFDGQSPRFATTGARDLIVHGPDGKAVARFPHASRVDEAAFLAARDFMISSDGGVLKLWDVRAGREAVQIVFFPDGRWIAIDPAGRFDTNDVERLDELAWSAPDQPLALIPITSFMRDYYQPGLVRRVLARVPLDPVPDLSTLNVVAPQLEIRDVVQTGGRLRVAVRVRDVAALDSRGRRRTADPRDVRLFRDGKLVGRQPAVLGGSADIVFEGIALPSDTPELELSAYAFNADGVKSATVRRTIQVTAVPGHRPRAVLVHVGIDRYADPALALDFAVADAEAIADRLERALAATHDVRSIRILGERDAPRVSREALIAVLRRLAGAPGGIDPTGLAVGLAPVTPDDLVVISFAGHGISTDEHFHLVFGEYAGGDPDTAGGTLDDQRLAAEIAGIDAGEIALVIDACQSGGAVDAGGFKPGPLGARGFGQMAYDKRIRVLAASQADDVALEARSVGHGLLTYALAIDGLDRRAADFAPADGTITLSEWLAWGAARVPVIADALVSGEAAGRGLVVVRVPTRPRVAQQPRLFDDPRRPSRVVLVPPR